MQVKNSKRAPPLPAACRQVVWPAFFSRAVNSTAASLAFIKDERIERATSPNSGTPSNCDRPPWRGSKTNTRRSTEATRCDAVSY